MFPVQVKVQQFQHAAAHPAHRIPEPDGQRGVGEKAGDTEQIGLADQDERTQHDHHGTDGIPPAPQGSGQDLVHTVEQGKEQVDPDEGSPLADHRFVSGKEPHGSLCQGHQDDAQGPVDQEGQQDGFHGAVVRPILLLSPYVLGHKGGGSHGHALHGQHDELVDLVVAAPAGHDGGTKEIDVGLDEDVGEGGDHALESCGQPDPENLAQDASVQAHVPEREPVDVVRTDQYGHGGCRGNELGQDGGIGHAGNAHLELDDEQQIQENVQDTGQDQEI